MTLHVNVVSPTTVLLAFHIILGNLYVSITILNGFKHFAQLVSLVSYDTLKILPNIYYMCGVV